MRITTVIPHRASCCVSFHFTRTTTGSEPHSDGMMLNTTCWIVLRDVFWDLFQILHCCSGLLEFFVTQHGIRVTISDCLIGGGCIPLVVRFPPNSHHAPTKTHEWPQDIMIVMIMLLILLNFMLASLMFSIVQQTKFLFMISFRDPIPSAP